MADFALKPPRLILFGQVLPPDNAFTESDRLLCL